MSRPTHSPTADPTPPAAPAVTPETGTARIPQQRAAHPAADSRGRLYERYASTHAGRARRQDTHLVFRRDIAPRLPADRGAAILDLGCGQGLVVDELHRLGYRAARGVDISPEQVAAARRAGVRGVEEGDLRVVLGQSRGRLDVVLALDLLEHLGRDELLDTLELAAAALRPGGLLLARVPNAASPFAGALLHGDLTHETCLTPRSARQALRLCGFTDIEVAPCQPVAHGLVSAGRRLLWAGVSGAVKLALAAETGSLRGHVVTRNMIITARTAAI